MGAPPPIELGTLGMADSLILMVLALVVFGPRRLPQIGRQIGKLMYEFRKASNDFKFQMEEELRLSEEADRRKKEEAERARALALNPPAPAIESQAVVGTQESVSAPSHPLYGSGYPEQSSAETAPAPPAESQIPLPRIQPPSTGAPVGRQGTEMQGPGTRDQGPEGQGTREQGNEGTIEQGPRDKGTEGPDAVPAGESAIAVASAGAEPVASGNGAAPAAAEAPTESTRPESVIHNG